ncbi:MAG: hypothetical protein R6U17_02105 [Thermoplasmata archaeon]
MLLGLIGPAVFGVKMGAIVAGTDLNGMIIDRFDVKKTAPKQRVRPSDN